MPTKYTKETALEVAKVIAGMAGKNVYLFGQAAKGEGHDIDIIIEIDLEVFKYFFEECESAGIHSVVKGVRDSMDLYWQYFSPKGIRTGKALELADVDKKMLANNLGKIAPLEDLDIICFPRGWQEDKMFEFLEGLHSDTDPDMMKNIKAQAVLVEP